MTFSINWIFALKASFLRPQFSHYSIESKHLAFIANLSSRVHLPAADSPAAGPGCRDFCLTAPVLFAIYRTPPAQIAQSVEQRTENPRVGSSILSLGTINARRASVQTLALFFFPSRLLFSTDRMSPLGELGAQDPDPGQFCRLKLLGRLDLACYDAPRGGRRCTAHSWGHHQCGWRAGQPPAVPSTPHKCAGPPGARARCGSCPRDLVGSFLPSPPCRGSFPRRSGR